VVSAGLLSGCPDFVAVMGAGGSGGSPSTGTGGLGTSGSGGSSSTGTGGLGTGGSGGSSSTGTGGTACTPMTCVLLAKTCGGPFSDGCLGMLNCNDGIQDGTETDVDCGGDPTHCATRCPIGMKCLVDGDCASSACTATTLVCVASQCTDGHKDGMETDVDCGGGTCPACALGHTCLVDTDCATNACDANTNICVANQCADHRQDGMETDVDCGGGVCLVCAAGQKCLVNADCASNNCISATHLCM
jgi:hypothetical protein